jgi:hypothetical protein
MQRRFGTLVVMSLLLTLMGSIIFGIFTAFGRIDLGFALVVIGFGFPGSYCWINYLVLLRRSNADDLEPAWSEKNNAPPV